jgi:Holliday junction DNA helicase RuvB
VSHFQFYDHGALFEIVTRSARILDYSIVAEGADEIARRSRGTPRIANRLLRRVRDFAQVDGDPSITRAVAEKALAELEVDHLGLDRIDRTLLRVTIEKYGGGPVGLETLAASTGEDAGTIEDVYEPYLLQQGLIQRTPRGRCVTASAYRHLGIAPPKTAVVAPQLFEEEEAGA